MPVLEENPAREGRRVLPIVLFGVYLALLAWIVLWRLDAPWVGDGALRRIKLVPLASSAGFSASAPLEVLANFLLFVPFGLYLGLLKSSWPWLKAAGTVAGASLVLEVAQYFLAVGSSDVTDLIVNTAGGLAGLGILTLARRSIQGRTTAIMTKVCLIMTALVLLATAIFIASPLHYGPPRHPGLHQQA